MAAFRLDCGGGDAMAAGIAALPQYSLAMLPVPLVKCPARRSFFNSKQGLIVRREKLSSRAKSRPSGIRASSAISETIVQRKSQKLPGTLKVQNKDKNVVFVAGATGKVGSRTVRELLKLGLQVRAGVRSVKKAQSILGGSFASEDESSTNSAPFFSPAKIFSFWGPSKKEEQLQIVECDIEKPDDIETALGNAGVVICTVGASEKEVLDVTGPYRIDYQATKNLINAAKNAKVNHFVLLTSLGTTKFGWPAAVLNLFWGVLIWKAKVEKALTESGLVYSIVRPGGMERPTDAYKETHNLRLATKDTFTGGQVSRLQVAELLACIAKNLELAENKVVEVIAETTAPLRAIEELLAEVPSQDTKQEEPETQKAIQTADKRQRTETLRGAEEKKAAEAKKKEELRQKLENELMTSKQKEKVATTEAEAIEKKRIELSEQAEAAAAAASGARALADALLVAARDGKLLSEEEKQKILSSSRLDAKKDSMSSRMITSPARIGKTRKPTSTKNSSQEVGGTPTEDINASRQMKSEKTLKSEDSNASRQMKSEKSLKSEDSNASRQVKSENNRKYTAAKDLTEEIQQKTETEPKNEVTSGDKDIGNSLTRIKETVTELESSATENARNVKEEAKSNIEKVRKPFRWFWQRPAEKTTAPLSPYTRYADQKPPSSPTPKPPSFESNGLPLGIDRNNEKQLVRETPIKTKPDEITEDTLSPYTRYSDLRPPTSPTPPPPKLEKVASEPKEKPAKAETVEDTATRDSAETVQLKSNLDRQFYSKQVREREKAALAKAKAAAFRWPWQKPKAPESAVSLDRLPSDAPAAFLNEAPTSERPPPIPVSRPLSPYARYEELKPPASPTPSTPKLQQTEQIDMGEASSQPLEAKKDSGENAAGNVAQEATQARTGLKWPWKG